MGGGGGADRATSALYDQPRIQGHTLCWLWTAVWSVGSEPKTNDYTNCLVKVYECTG